MRPAIILSLVIATLAIVFAVINPLPVDINFGFFTITGASLPLVLITTLLLGVLVGYLVWLPSRLALKKKMRSLERGAAPDSTVQLVSEDKDTMESAVGSDGPGV